MITHETPFKSKVGAIIQARCNSTRLEKKVLRQMPHGLGVSIIEQIIHRISKCSDINEVIVATSVENDDDEIVSLCKSKNIACFRGSKNNVLERFYEASRYFGLHHIVRLTADNPFFDHSVLSACINYHLVNRCDYTKTCYYPLGTNVETFTSEALEIAYNNASTEFEKEHVTPYFYKTQPELFKIGSLCAPPELQDNTLRLTIDTEQDYAMANVIYEILLQEKGNDFNLEDIISLCRNKPWISSINKDIYQKRIYNSIVDELNEAVKLIDKADMTQASTILKEEIKKISASTVKV